MIRTVRTWGRMVKFSHSVFAFPFAVSGAALAAVEHGITVRHGLWIVAAMVSARNAAMGFNRLADHRFDARNPRTAGRELPRGELSRGAVWVFTTALAAIFVLAAFQLNPMCGALSPVALAVILGYSYTKRFTWASHLILGLALGIAPVGGWLAVAGKFAVTPWLLSTAVLFWVAGFDVIYACQDEAFDRGAGLHSIPARFGVASALRLSRVFHVLAMAALAAVGWWAELHPVYWAGLAVLGAVFVREHRMVRPDDLSRIGTAFLNMNGIISVGYLVVILLSAALPAAIGP